MGIFDKLGQFFAKREVKPPSGDRDIVTVLPRQSEAGVFVNEAVTLGLDTAMACATLISNTGAIMPAHVLAPRSNDKQDGNQHLSNHPVERMLQVEPNPEMSAFSFRQSLWMAAILHGNAYAEIERDQTDRPFALWPIHPDRVEAYRSNGRMFYEIDGKSDITLSSADMFHLAGPSLGGGTVGFSIISLARNDLGEALNQKRYASNFVRNQAAPSGIVTVDGGTLTDAGMKRLRGEIDQLYTGPRKAGRIMIGDKGIDFKPIGVTPQDAEFLAQRRFSVETIARWFNVPPQMVGDTSKQTFANFEQAGLNFLTLAVMPWVVRFEQEVNRKLLTRAAAGRQQPFLKLNTAAIVRANLEAQSRAFALGRQWGWLSVNDIRRLQDMEPIGPEGDVYLTPMNMDAAGGRRRPGR